MKPSLVILTFNSADSVPTTLEQAFRISDDVFVVDSFSTDSSASIAEQRGAKVIQHSFINYGAQRNWAIKSLPCRYAWQLHLDADEYMEERLINAIRELPEDTHHNGFLIARYVRFLRRVLRHGGMSPTWHLRLFRADVGRCESRKYDQHFYLEHGTTGRLDGYMIDNIQMPLSEWTARHNRWSDAEVSELTHKWHGKRIEGSLAGTAIEQKRYWREKYNAFPLFVRAYLLFVYRYIIRLGFLDGREGLLFWTLQTFWFRFLVDAKIFEQSKMGRTHARTTDKRGETAAGPKGT